MQCKSLHQWFAILRKMTGWVTGITRSNAIQITKDNIWLVLENISAGSQAMKVVYCSLLPGLSKRKGGK